MTSVEAGGTVILVVNVDGEIHAVEGVCTHEDAMLSNGYMIEGRITCLLHLSQFDVRTGEALNPPATEPLRKFNVKIDGSRVLVEVP